MYTKNLFFLVYAINILNIYSSKLNIKEYYSYDNITDYINNIEFMYQCDVSQIKNKSEVLEIEDKDSWGMQYICKNDICTYLNSYLHTQSFIDIPDKNKNIKRYIIKSYDYDRIKLYKNPNYKLDRVYNCTKNDSQNFNSCEYYALISFKCTSNSQCLTNKCIDGYCIFNKENPTEFCTYIYSHSIFGHYSYMHCGKLVGDICKSNKECASVKCIRNSILRNGRCDAPPPGPSDTDYFNDYLHFLLVAPTIILISIYVYFRCTITSNKNKKKYKN